MHTVYETLSQTLAADLALALTMADLADVITMQHFQSSTLQIESKPDFTPVTEADRAAELALRAILAEQRPLDDILGEEFGASPDSSSRRWIIDPIDGTKNYVRGVPVWSTLIALTIDGAPVVGVVSAPALARRWWAATGTGAWTSALGASAKAIHVSAVTKLEDASFSYSDAIGWDERGAMTGLATLNSATWRQRAYGDFWSHMLVAEGALEAAVEPELALWDMAALDLIVTEAGGIFSNTNGIPGPHGGNGVSSNAALHSFIIESLRK